MTGSTIPPLEDLVGRAMSGISPGAREAARVRIADAACAVLLGPVLADWSAAAATFGRLAPGSAGLSLAAALAACCRLTEVDDIHLASCTTPGSVAVPSALVCAPWSDPDAVVEAVAAAYDACIGAAELLGGAFAPARGIWPTRAVASLGAAVGTSRALGLGHDEVMDACALAIGTSTAGVHPEPARSLSLGLAVGAGVAAAVAASEGMRGDLRLTDAWPGAGSATQRPTHPRRGERILESCCKPYAGARQVLAASAGLRKLVEEEKLDPEAVRTVEVAVPPPHAAMIDRPTVEVRLDTLASAQYHVATVLHSPAELDRLDHERPPSPPVAARMTDVSVRGADELVTGFPARWPARVRVVLASSARVEDLEAVPGETAFGWAGVEEKAQRLAAANGVDGTRLRSAIALAREGGMAELLALLVAGLRGPRGGEE